MRRGCRPIYGDVNKLDAFVGMVVRAARPGNGVRRAPARDLEEAVRGASRRRPVLLPERPRARPIERKFGITYRHTLADIIELNTGITVQPDVFKVADSADRPRREEGRRNRLGSSKSRSAPSPRPRRPRARPPRLPEFALARPALAPARPGRAWSRPRSPGGRPRWQRRGLSPRNALPRRPSRHVRVAGRSRATSAATVAGVCLLFVLVDLAASAYDLLSTPSAGADLRDDARAAKPPCRRRGHRGTGAGKAEG